MSRFRNLVSTLETVLVLAGSEGHMAQVCTEVDYVGVPYSLAQECKEVDCVGDLHILARYKGAHHRPVCDEVEDYVPGWREPEAYVSVLYEPVVAHLSQNGKPWIRHLQ